MNAVSNPNVIGQLVTMWKRRMLQFTKGSKEIMLISIILLFPLMEIIFISVIFNGIQRVID